jgi:hypothetical protein
MHWHNLLSQNLNLFDLISNVRNLFDHLSHFCVDNYFLFNPHELNWLWFDSVLNHYFLNYSWNLNYLFNDFFHWNEFFNDSINRYRNLNWHNYLPLYFNNFGDLNVIVDYLFNWNISRNLLNHFDNSLLNKLMIYNLLLHCL